MDIRPRIAVDEMDRPAVDDRFYRTARRPLHPVLDVAEEKRDHLLERDPAVLERGVLVDQLRRQNGFDRSHEPAVAVADIGRDSRSEERRVGKEWVSTWKSRW